MTSSILKPSQPASRLATAGAFRLGDGRTLEFGKSDPQMRHLDHAWASTVHAFQGRTVDNVIAVMEAKHPKLSTQKSFYVEISRARHSAYPDNPEAGINWRVEIRNVTQTP